MSREVLNGACITSGARAETKYHDKAANEGLIRGQGMLQGS